MRCKVKQGCVGFHEGRRRRAGEIVEIAGETVPKWAEEVKRVKAVEVAPEPQAPLELETDQDLV